MTSTVKLTTGMSILTAGIGFFLACVYIGVFNFGAYGLQGAITALFLVLGTAMFLFLKPGVLSTTLFGIATTVLVYMMMTSKSMDNSQMVMINMIVCFIGLFLVVNGFNSSSK